MHTCPACGYIQVEGESWRYYNFHGVLIDLEKYELKRVGEDCWPPSNLEECSLIQIEDEGAGSIYTYTCPKKEA